MERSSPITTRYKNNRSENTRIGRKLGKKKFLLIYCHQNIFPRGKYLKGKEHNVEADYKTKQLENNTFVQEYKNYCNSDFSMFSK